MPTGCSVFEVALINVNCSEIISTYVQANRALVYCHVCSVNQPNIFTLIYTAYLTCCWYGRAVSRAIDHWLSSRILGFIPRPLYVGFIVNRWYWEIFVRVFQLSSASIIPQAFYAHGFIWHHSCVMSANDNSTLQLIIVKIHSYICAPEWTSKILISQVMHFTFFSEHRRFIWVNYVSFITSILPYTGSYGS